MICLYPNVGSCSGQFDHCASSYMFQTRVAQRTTFVSASSDWGSSLEHWLTYDIESTPSQSLCRRWDESYHRNAWHGKLQSQGRI